MFCPNGAGVTSRPVWPQGLAHGWGHCLRTLGLAQIQPWSALSLLPIPLTMGDHAIRPSPLPLGPFHSPYYSLSFINNTILQGEVFATG